MNLRRNVFAAIGLLGAGLAAAEGDVGGENRKANSEHNDVRSTQAVVIEDFFKRSRYSDPKISPNGRLVALFENKGGLRDLVVKAPPLPHELRVDFAKAGEGDVAIDLDEAHWVDNDHIIFTWEQFGRQKMGLGQVIYERGLPVRLQVSLLGNDWYLIDPLPNLENKAVVVIFSQGNRWLHVIDVTDPRKRIYRERDTKLQRKIAKTFGWLVDSTGRVKIAIEYDEERLSKTLWYQLDNKSSWKNVWHGDPEVTIVPVLVLPDDRTIVVLSNEFAEHTVLTTYDRIDKTYGEIIFAIEGRDIESAMVNPAKTHVVMVRSLDDGLLREHYIGDAKALYPELLDSDRYGSAPYVIDQSLNELHAIVRTSTSDNPGSYYLLDAENKTSYELGDLRPWLTKYRLGKSQTLTLTSDDGLLIEAFLTMPEESGRGRPPLIVMPHGGPINVRDTRHFDPSVQVLSNFGYAVLQVNYRGSGGLGKIFEGKGEGEWGRRIEDDIELALDAVIDLSIVDESKICIYGSSYGGYSALISTVRSPERYRCAASFAGVTDMTLLFHEFRVNRSNILRASVERIVGDPDEDVETLIRYSPVYNADNINVPVFLAHGKTDRIVDFEHFYRMRMMLDYYDKKAEYLVIENEGHGLRYVVSNVTFYDRLDKFFRASMQLPQHTMEQSLNTGNGGLPKLVPTL